MIQDNKWDSCKLVTNSKCISVRFIVRITGPYKYTDQLLVWYLSSYTKCTDTWYTEMYRYTTHTNPLLDRYIPPVPSGMPRYIKPWFN